VSIPDEFTTMKMTKNDAKKRLSSCHRDRSPR
jgi:hypothetical protein